MLWCNVAIVTKERPLKYKLLFAILSNVFNTFNFICNELFTGEVIDKNDGMDWEVEEDDELENCRNDDGQEAPQLDSCPIERKNPENEILKIFVNCKKNILH